MDLFLLKRAASFPLLPPLNPVILNELVLSLRSTSEMKDLLIYAAHSESIKDVYKD
jgi:hypothetical protein